MSLAVLLSFVCHLKIGELTILNRKDLLISDTPAKKVYVMLTNTKIGTNSSVSIRFT